MVKSYRLGVFITITNEAVYDTVKVATSVEKLKKQTGKSVFLTDKYIETFSDSVLTEKDFRAILC